MEKKRFGLIAAIITAASSIKLVFGYPGGCCRFHPNCTAYAREAFENHSFIRAAVLVLNRLVRCNPLSRGGYDPVPKY
jgi:putative membrane protein insertion efficiency factor